MPINSNELVLLGDADSLMHLVPDHSCRLQAEVIDAYQQLRGDAAQAGFDLRIASGFRDFSRQLVIWNGKVDGSRPIVDDAGRVIDPQGLAAWRCVQYILRFSALPGTSRHHWGTDMDVFDKAAMPADYQLQLTVAETRDTGPFAELHRWLDERITADKSYGFFRPYAQDLGGVSPEPWHLSYAPLAQTYSQLWNPHSLYQRLHRESIGHQAFLLMALPQIIQRYVMAFTPPPWK
jgi:LAS superfamily LD-carboxypeptidase LdcB